MDIVAAKNTELPEIRLYLVLCEEFMEKEWNVIFLMFAVKYIDYIILLF